MSRVIVGKWGKSLAVRIPLDVARQASLDDGEQVDVEVQEGDILIRRSAAKAGARELARRMAAEILEDGKGRSLAGISIRQLIDEGRRG